VSIPIEPLALAVFDEKNNAWTWPHGRYTLSVGGSSRNLPLQASAELY
jgi:hypothetical protein